MEHFLTHSMKPALPWYQSQRRYKKRKLEFNSPYRNGKILNKIQANQTQPNKRIIYHDQGFLGSSVAKESACNAEDPASIPGSGRFPGEGIGYPLQYSWVSLVAQLMKNPPAIWETWVWSLGWETHWRRGTATHSSILAWRMDCIVHGVAKSQTWLSNFHELHSSDFIGTLTLLELTRHLHCFPGFSLHFFPSGWFAS